MPIPDSLQDQAPRKKPRVYLAGKIAQHGWRERLTYRTIYPRDPLDPNEFEDTPNFVCTGPFFACFGHGLSHVPGTHGQGEKNKRARVFDVSLARIAKSDFVFARINETDCFGTLVEIGHAHAIGVPVFLNLGPDLTRRQTNDFWFVAQACHLVHGNLEQAFWNAIQAWRSARALSVMGGSNG